MQVSLLLTGLTDVSCVEADGTSIFIGTSSGELLHYVVNRDQADPQERCFSSLLASRQSAAGPVKELLLLSTIGLAAVLADDVLSFFRLPEFAPASDFKTVRGVRGVVRSIDAVTPIQSNSVELTVFTAKKIRQIKVTAETIRLTRELEYNDAVAICQRGSVVCAATRATYDLLELERRAKIPLFSVVQGESEPSGAEYDPYTARIVSVTPTEFLLSSGSPESTTAIGMFVTTEGEITRGTLMLSEYPLAILPKDDLAYALLPSGKIEVHDIATQTITGTFDAASMIGLKQVSNAVATDSEVLDRLTLASYRDEGDVDDDGFTDALRAAECSAEMLCFGHQSVHSITNGSPFRQIDELLDAGDLQQALSALETACRTVDERVKTIWTSYTNQKAGILYLQQLLFDDAIDTLDKGRIDPRILISLLPQFEADLHGVKVFKGVKKALNGVTNIRSMIHDNLSNTVDDPQTLAELQKILEGNAVELLRRNLTKHRERSTTESKPLQIIVEQSLLSILLDMDRAEVKPKLKDFFKLDLVDEAGILSMLERKQRWMLLADYYRKTGRRKDQLSLWRRLLDGELSDPETPPDLLDRLERALVKYGDDDDIWELGIWLTKRDPRAGTALVFDSIKQGRVTWELERFVNEIRHQLPDDFTKFLELVILVHDVRDVKLCSELASGYAVQAVDLFDDGICKELENWTADFASLSADEKSSYAAYIDTRMANLDPGALQDRMMNLQRVRQRLVAFLSSDIALEASMIEKAIEPGRQVLLPETILLAGRTGRHEEALDVLVDQLHDYEGAEWYCYHGGGGLAWHLTTAFHPSQEDTLVDDTHFAKLAPSSRLVYGTTDKHELINVRCTLFPALLARIIASETEDSGRAAALLNRWGRYFDLADEIRRLPDGWALRSVRGFVSGGLVRLQQDKRETQVTKSLARSDLDHVKSSTFTTVS
ncbi:hypothetical protein PYCC9005_000960 [Savitreella phatthalungensis]